MALPRGFQMVDAMLVVTKALPNGATDVTSDALDTMNGTNGTFQAETEFVLDAPALVVGDLGNGDTIIYDLLHSVNSDMSSPATITAAIITQTGAGGVGAAAASKTFKLPKDVRRYIAIKATNSGAGDASDKSLTLTAKF